MVAASTGVRAQAANTDGNAVVTPSSESASLAAQLFPRPPTAPGQSATLLPDGRWLMLGGEAPQGGTPSAAMWVRDAATRRNTLLPVQLGQPRTGHSATLLPSGQVLILGGVDASGSVPGPELLDPTNGTVTAAADMGLMPRKQHAATLLADGRLLITGGLSSRGVPLVEAELLDTRSLRVERFNARAEAARFGHLAHLLPSHAVVVLGGYDAQRKPLASAEVYDPQQQRFIPIAQAQLIEQARPMARGEPPRVVGSVPADGSRDAGLAEPIVLRLSKRMLVTTLTARSVTLVGPGGPIDAKVVPAESGMLLFVVPSMPLLPAASYTLFVKGASDEHGLPLPAATLAFATAALPADRAAAARVDTARQGLPNAATARSAAALALRQHTALPAPPAPQMQARAVADQRAKPTQPDPEDWLITREHLRGRWYYKQPFAGTMREYFKHVQDQRTHHHAGLLRAAAGVTAVSGSIKRINGQPLPGVALAIGERQTVSDANGNFILTDVPPGNQTLVIEGSSANRPGVFYGSYLRHVRVRAGQTQLLDDPVYLAKLDPKGTIHIPSPTPRDMVVTTPSIPGLEVHIPAGTVVRDRQGNVLTAINISPVPIDRAAFPMPQEAEFPVYFTMQPSGAFIQSASGGAPLPIKLVYPNYTEQPPGTQARFWAYDPQERNWFDYGSAVVSADGKTLRPDDRVGVYQFTGFSYGIGGAGGGSSNGTCESCMCGGGGGGAGSGGASGGSSGSGTGGGTPGSGGGNGGGTRGPGTRMEGMGAGAGPGPGAYTCGDPILLSRGSFLHSVVDMRVEDIVPLLIERTTMDQDAQQRSFGVGSTLHYDMNLHVLEANVPGDGFHNAKRVALIQPNGIQLVFDRVLSSGAGNTDTTWEHAGAGPFHKAVITSNVAKGTFGLRMRDGTVFTFYGYGWNKLQTIADRNGNLVEIARSPALTGNITKVISPFGRYLEFTYDGSSRITLIKDNIGRTTRYDYWSSGPGSGRLKTVTQADGAVWQYAYNTAGRVESITDAGNKRMVLNEFDGNGRVAKQTYADDTTVRVNYVADGGGKVTQAEVTDRRGNVRRVSFDGQQRIVENIYPLGKPEAQTHRFNYDPATGRMTTMTDALGRTTRYGYDVRGNRTTITRLDGTPSAQTEQFVYDPSLNLPTSHTDSGGLVTEYRYDARGNLQELKLPDGQRFTYTHDAYGRVLTVTDPSDKVTLRTYAGPDLATEQDPLGNITQYGYDAVGRLLVARDALGNQTEWQYDAMSRATLLRDGGGNAIRLEYDPMGNLITYRDPANNATGYTHDARHRLKRRTDALLASDDRAYDEADALKRYTDRGGRVSGRRYDALGRVVFEGYGATAAQPDRYTEGVRYTWDGGNRLVRLEEGACTGADCATFTVGSSIVRTWDELDRLQSETTDQGQVSYTYRADGQRQTLQVQGQPQVSYHYDAQGRLERIEQAAGVPNGGAAQVIGFEYDAAGRRHRVRWPNGVKAQYAWDDAQRLSGITWRRADDSVLGDVSYGYDAAGRRVSRGGSLGEVGLPAEVAGEAEHNANNQLRNWDGAALSYDVHGALTGDGSASYEWDARGRLTRIRQGEVEVAAYGYDALNRRIWRRAGGRTQGYVYDGWNVVQELNAAQANPGRTNYAANVINGLELDERYVRIVAPHSGNAAQPDNASNPSATQPMVTALVGDALGSTQLVLRADQQVQARYVYEPYGWVQQITPVGQPASDNPYQYTGREYEGASLAGNSAAAPLGQLYHYRHRYYSAALHRFISEDPIEFAGGSNLYGYVGGDPFALSDTLGLDPTIASKTQQCIQDCRNKRDQCMVWTVVAGGGATVLGACTLGGGAVTGVGVGALAVWCGRMADVCMDKCLEGSPDPAPPPACPGKYKSSDCN